VYHLTVNQQDQLISGLAMSVNWAVDQVNTISMILSYRHCPVNYLSFRKNCNN